MWWKVWTSQSFFQGWPRLTSHGLGDKWAPWRGSSCDQSGTERSREHTEGASGEGPRLERGWEHQDSGTDLSQHGPAEELRGRDSPSVSPHHLTGLSNCYHTLLSVRNLFIWHISHFWCKELESLGSFNISTLFCSLRSLENLSVEMQSLLQNRRRKTCFHHPREKTRSALSHYEKYSV